MAFLSHQAVYPMRPLNKEPEWSSAYDDLFNQYIDTDHLEFDSSSESTREEDSFDDFSSKTIDYSSTSSCQPGGSPPRKWSAKNSGPDFWTNKLRSFEESAACLENDQSLQLSTQRDVLTASSSDFLSLGGWPSPHISAPPSPSRATKCHKEPLNSQVQFKAIPKPRSPGVQKAYRSSSGSPKMMSPSRFRSGFRDVWADKASGEIRTYAMALPLRPAPLSPPPSAKIGQTVDVAAFYSPREINAGPFDYTGFYDSGASPSCPNFHEGLIVHTPNASPLTSPGVERNNFCGDMSIDGAQDEFTGQSMYYAVPPTAPPSTRSSWVAPGMEEDDCELSPTFNPWSLATAEAGLTTAANTGVACTLEDIAPFASFYPIASEGLANGGLMISCDPTFTTDYSNEAADSDFSALPAKVCLGQRQLGRQQRTLSRSPSPTHGSVRSPRSQRASSKGRRGRTPSTPRSPRGVSKASFVNFTPSDSAKLLTGVAPSGSSKTKARREKEAFEKRRQFSQAAVRAVTEAGGDIKRLRDVML